MYGMIFGFLREYVEKNHGQETWRALLVDNNIPGCKIYNGSSKYPDSELVGIAQSASKALKIPVGNILEDFGAYVGPRLIEFYSMYLENMKITSTLDVIEFASSNNQRSIHDRLEQHNSNRKPPTLLSDRNGDELILQYVSGRGFCPVVQGIIRGMSVYFDEEIRVKHNLCTHKGNDKCVFELKKQFIELPVLKVV